MKIREFSSQFCTLVFTKDMNLGSSIKVNLGRAGYEVFYLENENNLLQTISEAQPHVVILDLNSIQTLLNALIEKINTMNSEIKIIFISNSEQFQVLSGYSEFNVYDILALNLPQLDSRVLWAVDRCCEMLYLTYKNEQIFSELTLAKEDQKKSLSQVTIMSDFNDYKPCFELIENLKKSESKDDVIQILFQNLRSFSCLYFKFLSSLNSFVLTNVSPQSELTTEGVGCALPQEETKDLIPELILNIIPPTLNNLIEKMFKFQKIGIQLNFDKENLDGIFVYDLDFGNEESQENNLKKDKLFLLRNYLSVTALYYSYFSLDKKLEFIETLDPLTEVYNKRFYDKKIYDEFERAKRLKQGLSLIKISIDDFAEIEKSLGLSSRDQLIKSIAGVLNKTSRTNDLTCRTSENEFSIILPHCGKKGATLRAERLRRLIENQSMLDSGLKITASLGVSEYPTLSHNVATLNDTAEKARNFILSKGGNRICLYKVPADFVPEFDIEES
jgi:diguanylate cyclase (GGDEF)-like protein